MNYETICMTCTGKNSEMISIFDSYKFSTHICKIFNIITDCASVQIQKFDGFSERICRGCLARLSEAHTFKKLCEDSDHKFRNRLIASEETEVKNESSKQGAAIIYDDNFSENTDRTSKSVPIKKEQIQSKIKADEDEYLVEEIIEEAEVARRPSSIKSEERTSDLEDSQNTNNPDSTHKCEYCDISSANENHIISITSHPHEISYGTTAIRIV